MFCRCVRPDKAWNEQATLIGRCASVPGGISALTAGQSFKPAMSSGLDRPARPLALADAMIDRRDDVGSRRRTRRLGTVAVEPHSSDLGAFGETACIRDGENAPDNGPSSASQRNQTMC